MWEIRINVTSFARNEVHIFVIYLMKYFENALHFFTEIVLQLTTK